MTQANQMTPMPTVIRSRLRSATDEPPRRAGDAAAEHVGEAAAAALVEQDEQDQQAAGDHEHDAVKIRVTAETPNRTVPQRSQHRHVVEAADAAELVGLQARAADQGSRRRRPSP